MEICIEIKRKFIRLSKGQRKVAQFVVDNPNVVATHIASEVGRLAGVSESTVIRFCYAMDLSGFSELQDKIKGDLIDNGDQSFKKKPIQVSKEKNAVGVDIVNQNIAGISRTFKQLNERHFEEVVQLLHTTKKIHILGFRQSAPAAGWLYNNLTRFRDHVYFIGHDTEKIVQQLTLMDQDSLLVMISLEEEYEDSMTIVEIAKRKKAKMVVVHDNGLPVVQEPTTKVLFVPSTQEGATTGAVTVFILLQALVESVVKKSPLQYEQFQKRHSEGQKKSS